jgi:hypothetical protein
MVLDHLHPLLRQSTNSSPPTGSFPYQHPNRRNHMQARTTPQRHLPRLHRHARNTGRVPRPRHSHATRPTSHRRHDCARRRRNSTRDGGDQHR